MAVTIRVKEYGNGDKNSESERLWRMKFVFNVGGLVCTFVAEKPYLCRLEEWRALERGERDLALDQGYGHDYILPEAGGYTILAAPYGRRRGTGLRLTASGGAFAEALGKSLDEAVRLGLQFGVQ